MAAKEAAAAILDVLGDAEDVQRKDEDEIMSFEENSTVADTGSSSSLLRLRSPRLSNSALALYGARAHCSALFGLSRLRRFFFRKLTTRFYILPFCTCYKTFVLNFVVKFDVIT